MNVLVPHGNRIGRSRASRDFRSKPLLRLRLMIGLVVADSLGLLLAFSAAEAIRFGTLWDGRGPFLFGAFLPVFLLCGIVLNAFGGEVLLRRSIALARGMAALTVSTLITSTSVFFLQVSEDISRLHFGLGIALAALLLTVIRLIYVLYSARMLDHTLHSIVELRDGTASASTDRSPSFDTSAFFDPHNPTPESLDRLGRLIANVDRVVVNCPDDRREAWAHVMQGMNVHGEILIASVGEVRAIGIDSFGGKTTLLVGRGPLTLPERFSKRVLDLAIAASLVVFLAPLLLVVSVAVKLGSPGPVLFKQPRIGRQNRLFYVWKFRSMRIADCDSAGEQSTQREDPRITPFGRFIRRTSIDELPQLFNVLMGNMSIVGPRPHAISSRAEDRLFWEIDSRYWHRHACKPGLTGLAQVRGYRGSTLVVKDIVDRLASDLEYVARWSLFLDMLIIMQTAKVVFHKNAY